MVTYGKCKCGLTPDGLNAQPEVGIDQGTGDVRKTSPVFNTSEAAAELTQ